MKFPEEEEEDILRESDSRFVLFPIKYNEVCMVGYHTRVLTRCRYGKHINVPKLVFGPPKSLILDMTSLIGMTG